MDTIDIKRLRVSTTVGVPDEERANPQEVEISLTMSTPGRLRFLGDDLSKTVDYYAVSRRVSAVAGTGERKLIETLADDVAEMVLDEFRVARVVVEIRKFILPEAEYVAVRIEREG
jgi:FolB domain-containing protein